MAAAYQGGMGWQWPQMLGSPLAAATWLEIA